MDQETTALYERWILTFLEAPPLVDAELMRAILAEHESRLNGAPAVNEKTFKAGDTVQWDHSQGTSTGKIVRKLTKPMKIKDHKVAASPENPEYLVKSSKTGAQAAHKPSELRKA